MKFSWFEKKQVQKNVFFDSMSLYTQIPLISPHIPARSASITLTYSAKHLSNRVWRKFYSGTGEVLTKKQNNISKGILFP